MLCICEALANQFTMKVSELLKILKKDGWHLYRNGRSYNLYRHSEKSGQIPIPRHGSKELAKGTEERILKDAGLKLISYFKEINLDILRIINT